VLYYANQETPFTADHCWPGYLSLASALTIKGWANTRMNPAEEVFRLRANAQTPPGSTLPMGGRFSHPELSIQASDGVTIKINGVCYETQKNQWL
jgi:hypothetical protein